MGRTRDCRGGRLTCRAVTDSPAADWPSNLDASLDDLADTAVHILTEFGPMTEDQIEVALVERGAYLDEAVCLDDVLDAGDGRLAVLADGRWAALPALLVDRVFTHRVTGPELEHDMLTMHPDLGVVMELVDREEYRLSGGAPVDYVLAEFDADTLTERGIPLDLVDDAGALLLPPGYLREQGCREGDLIALGVGQQGLRCEIVTAPAGPVAALEQRLEAILAQDSNPPVLLDTAVQTACADDPSLFTEPLPPLVEMLDAGGFAHDGDWLGPRGFDFPQWRTRQQCAAVARRHNLHPDEARAVVALHALYRKFGLSHQLALPHRFGPSQEYALYQQVLPKADTAEGGSGDDDDAVLRAMVPALAEPSVAEAVLAETLGPGRDGAEALVSFVETIEPMAPRTARPALLWLRGKAYERNGSILKAEADYEAAQSIDPHWAPALFALARFASDRGDADRGLTLLRRAGVSPDHSLANLLSLFEATARPEIGRNDPCWCGSGREHKKCHLHERAPLEERGLWLSCKAIMYVTEWPWRAAIIEAAQLWGQHEDSDDEWFDMVTNPFISDVVLFEGGAFVEFLATRGDLLPDDERLLAEQWLLTNRSVYTVEDVQAGVGLTLRDARTGESCQVQDQLPNRMLRVGDLVCTRLVPAGHAMRIFATVEQVAMGQRDELIALLDSRPDHLRLTAFFAQCSAAAVTYDTEGDPVQASGELAVVRL